MAESIRTLDKKAKTKRSSSSLVAEHTKKKTKRNTGSEGTLKKKKKSRSKSDADLHQKKNAKPEKNQRKKQLSSGGNIKKKKRPASDEQGHKKKQPTGGYINKGLSISAFSKKKKRRTKGDGNLQVKPKTPGQKLFSLVWDIVFYMFLALLIGGAIFFNFSDSPDKSFFGYRFMTVLTDSMAPNPDKPELKDGFKSGSIIFLKQVKPEDLKVKDIITFYPVADNTDAFLTHRIIEVNKEMNGQEGLFITTQGDANDGADVPITGSQVVGKVVYSLPFVGNLLDFVRENLIVVVIFIAALFGFFMVLKYYFSIEEYKKAGKKKRKRKPVNAGR